MTEIRELSGQKPRVETGPTRFGDDWPGLFIRGDDAFHYLITLRSVLSDPEVVKHLDPLMCISVLNGLVSDLESCILK